MRTTTSFKTTARVWWILLGLLAVPLPVLAWGPDGHKIVAQIATGHLTPQSQAAVRSLLGNQTLMVASTWADEIRNDSRYRWSAPLHYANVVPGSKAFDLRRDCPKGNCVVGAITKYAAVLRDPNATPDQKQEALKFLVHFVADVHQPLHVSHAHDKGGNDVKVEFFYNRTDLHKLWDDLLIRRAKKPWRQYADDLARGITKDQYARWARITDPSAWATESYQLAVSNAYAVPKDGLLGQEYFDRNLPVVNERLSMAGVRLAVLLNQIFADAKLPATMPSVNQAQAEQKAVKYVGSRRSSVYHLPTCSVVKTIKPENLVEYESAPAGKRPHSCCTP